jgi:hypothetical protein
MANYGEILDDFNPVNEHLYSLFVAYFANPTLTKIKNQAQFSMYAVKFFCLLSKECRYLILFTSINSYTIGSVDEMKNIKWVSLQTRTLFEQFDCLTHSYSPSSSSPLNVLIERNKITDEASFYSCPTFPITITLLHTKQKDKLSYQNSGTIIAALETFETIITFNNQV